MKKYFFIILFLSLALTLVCSTRAQASTLLESTNLQTSNSNTVILNVMLTQDGLYQYTVTNNEVSITKYLGNEANVVIPEQIDNMNVTTIGDLAFSSNDSLKSINLTNVKTINKFAFNDCSNLIAVSGSRVTTLGNSAFQFCSTLQLVDMKNVVTLGNGTFQNCNNLTSISMPNITLLTSYTFANCEKLTTIDMPNVTLIGQAAFQNCKSLKYINMEYVTIIEAAAFTWSGITSIDLKYVTSVEGQAFYDCDNLQLVNLPATTYIGQIAFKESTIKTISLPNVDTLSAYAFDNATIENLTLSNHIAIPAASEPIFTNAKIQNLTINYGNDSISAVTLQDFDQYVSQLGLDSTMLTGKYVKNNIGYKDLLNPDIIAPVITLIGDPIVTIPQGTLYVDLGVTVTDNSGQPTTLIIDNPVDTSKSASYTITYSATDISGNYSKLTRIVNVAPKYQFSGILQPINKDGSSIFKSNSTIPVKFQLKDENGQFVSTVTATLSYQKISNQVDGKINEASSTSAATTGNAFRYDLTNNQYIFNLKTKGLSAGQYKLIITLDDGQVFDDTNIILK